MTGLVFVSKDKTSKITLPDLIRDNMDYVKGNRLFGGIHSFTGMQAVLQNPGLINTCNHWKGRGY